MASVSIPSHEEIREIIRDELAQFRPLAPPPEPDKYIGKEEAMELLGGISRATLDNYRRRGLIQSYKIGQRVLFRKSELLEAIANLNS